MYARTRDNRRLLQKSKPAVAIGSVMPDKESEFHPMLLGKALSRAPASHLSVWVESKGIKIQDVKHLVRTDNRAMHKIVSRACVISLKQTIGPMQKAVGDRAYAERYKAVDEQRTENLTWSGAFEIDWNIFGHYTLMPIQPRTAYPQEHIYTELVLSGVRLSLDADHVLRGS